MTRKQTRLAFVVGGLLLLGGAVGVVLQALNDNIVFFVQPSDVAKRQMDPSQRFRIGGLVASDSVQKDGETTRFLVTDFASSVPVVYKGMLPDLFREGQGVVAEGRLGRDGVFEASTVLAKHDENYMPPEVADALKKSGQWQGDKAKGEPAPTMTD